MESSDSDSKIESSDTDTKVALAQVHGGHVLAGIGIISVAAVFCSMFYAMSTPSPVKPPPTPAELLSDSIETNTKAVNTCVEDMYREHTNSLSTNDHTAIILACSQAIDHVTQSAQQKLGGLAKQPNSTQ